MRGPHFVGKLLVGADHDVLEVMSRIIPGGVIPHYRVCFGLVARGRIAGGVLVFGVRPGIEAEICIGVDDPRALSRQALRHLHAAIFEGLGVRRVVADTDKANKRARKALERAGFVQEGVKRRAAANGGNVIVYGLLKEEFRL